VRQIRKPGGNKCAVFGVISGPNQEVESEVQRAGVDAVLLRPVRRSVLVTAVKEALSPVAKTEKRRESGTGGVVTWLQGTRALVRVRSLFLCDLHTVLW
jgi:hypothetical protein